MIRRADRSAAAALERRAARADLLAGEASAAEPLAFAAGLFRVQAEAASVIDAAVAGGAVRGVLAEDLAAIEPALAPILRFAARKGPPTLREQARARERGGADATLDWWRGERSGRADYLSRALLRPYAQVLAARDREPDPPAGPRAEGCPFCGAPACVGLRRADGGDAGAQRWLACGLCGREWVVNRIRCPSCGEESPDQLPQFGAERMPLARIEACDRCRRYVKSIDLTVDARAIPEVDDLASLALDLWAADQGYVRIEPGLAGL